MRLWQEFDRLLSTHPDYTPGILWPRRPWRRRGVWMRPRHGSHKELPVRRRTGNQHALSEMQAMLEELD